MEYTAVIRTLGTAGEKYKILLNSLISQTCPPTAIYVYIPYGYAIPRETIGIEKYFFVRKGMVAQRALQYNEVETEYLLLLDDDVYLPSDAVELLFQQMQDNEADIISPDVFNNSGRRLSSRLLMTISGRMRARHHDQEWGYKVMMTCGYSYNAKPTKGVYRSQTNAGPCCLCKKSTMLDIHFDEELWLDRLKYPQGEDQTMYYKMYKKGYKQLTSYNSGILHLDAGANRNPEKEKMLIYSDFRFKTIFWHRFIYTPERNILLKIWSCLAIGYAIAFAFFVSLFKLRFDILKIKYSAIKDGLDFIRSSEYKSLPLI